MEKAAVLDSLAIRKAGRPFIKRHDCIYVGSEFCQNILPKMAEVESLYDKGARKVAILTSFMVQDGLLRAQDSLSAILEKYKNLEIVVNDFGLLSYLNEFYPESAKSIGRPLSIDFLRMDNSCRARFFRKHGITGLETDEVHMLQNIPAGSGLKINLHYPYRFVAMTRLCPFAGRITPDCGHKCYGRILRLKVPGCASTLLAKNNAYFVKYKPGAVPNVDRIVKHSFAVGSKSGLK